MPIRPHRILTDAAKSATGAEVELTPLTAMEPNESQNWRQRFKNQVNNDFRSAGVAQQRPGAAASYYDPGSRFSTETEVVLPRKVRVSQKKRLSKWRVIFMIVFVLSVMANAAFITLFVYWYIKFKQVRDIWNETFASIATPSPSSGS